MQLPPARAPPSAPTSQALAGFTRIETTGVGAFGLRPLYCPWPRFVDTPPWRGPSHCALCALRRTSGGATMTIPGGAGTTHPPVLGAPASLIGSELSVYLAPALRFAPVLCRYNRRTSSGEEERGWGSLLRGSSPSSCS